MSAGEQQAIIAIMGIMRAAGLTKVEVPMEYLTPLRDEGTVLTIYDDLAKDYRVFKLDTPGEVIEGEEVPDLPFPAELSHRRGYAMPLLPLPGAPDAR